MWPWLLLAALVAVSGDGGVRENHEGVVDSTLQVTLELIQHAVDKERDSQAFLLGEHVLKSYPNSPEIKSCLYVLLARLGNFQEALDKIYELDKSPLTNDYMASTIANLEYMLNQVDTGGGLPWFPAYNDSVDSLYASGTLFAETARHFSSLKDWMSWVPSDYYNYLRLGSPIAEHPRCTLDLQFPRNNDVFKVGESVPVSPKVRCIDMDNMESLEIRYSLSGLSVVLPYDVSTSAQSMTANAVSIVVAELWDKQAPVPLPLARDFRIFSTETEDSEAFWPGHDPFPSGALAKCDYVETSNPLSAPLPLGVCLSFLPPESLRQSADDDTDSNKASVSPGLYAAVAYPASAPPDDKYWMGMTVGAKGSLFHARTFPVYFDFVKMQGLGDRINASVSLYWCWGDYPEGAKPVRVREECERRAHVRWVVRLEEIGSLSKAFVEDFYIGKKSSIVDDPTTLALVDSAKYIQSIYTLSGSMVSSLWMSLLHVAYQYAFVEKIKTSLRVLQAIAVRAEEECIFSLPHSSEGGESVSEVPPSVSACSVWKHIAEEITAAHVYRAQMGRAGLYLKDLAVAPFELVPANPFRDALCDPSDPCLASACSYYTLERDAGRAAVADPDAIELQRWILTSQMCSECKRTLQFSNVHVGTGIGSRLTTMTAALRDSLFTGRTMTSQLGEWIFARGDRCPDRTHHCFFEEITTCPQTHERTGIEYSVMEPDVEHVWYHQNSTLPAVPSLARRFHHRGPLWFHSQLLYFLVQPNPQTIAYVNRVKASFGDRWKHPMIAMHVRHGDKGIESALFSMDAYMKPALQLQRNFGVSTILLSTENEDVIRQTKNYPQFDFLYTEYPRLNSNITASILDGSLDAHEETLHSLANLYLAAHCDYVIATMSSNWGRAIAKISYALYGHFPHVLSLDAFVRDVGLQLTVPAFPGDTRSAVYV